MSQPYIGEIRITPFTFAPSGWSMCDGSLLAISQFEALYQLIGTTYGGDGLQTFGLPDLRSRTPVGLGPYNVMGATGGQESVTLSLSQIPSHSHLMGANTIPGTAANPRLSLPASLTNGMAYGGSGNVLLGPNAAQVVGGSMPHNNVQPYLTLTYIISLFGIFPSQN